MKLEIIQYTLKCKEELDRILDAIDKIRALLFNNDLDEAYASTLMELEHLKLSAYRAIENLNAGLEFFIN